MMLIRLVETKGGELAIQGRFPGRVKWGRHSRILKRFGRSEMSPKLERRIRNWMMKKGHQLSYPLALEKPIKIDEK